MKTYNIVPHFTIRTHTRRFIYKQGEMDNFEADFPGQIKNYFDELAHDNKQSYEFDIIECTLNDDGDIIGTRKLETYTAEYIHDGKTICDEERGEVYYA